MSRVIVVGGGASGMMAAFRAAKNGHEVLLLEKNVKLGKKIYITGKGRCNFTNACDVQDFFSNVVSNPKFLYSALYAFDPQRMMDFVEGEGVPVKVERGKRAFPRSDHASDITKALESAMKKANVEVRLNACVSSLLVSDNRINGVVMSDGNQFSCDDVILATGGVSYPSTGSTGDGHRMLSSEGIAVTELYPALVPFETEEKDITKLQGLSLKNVNLKVFDGKKICFDDFGEMLFTHFGISGPLVLSASSHVTKILKDKKITVSVDLKPALSHEKLEQRIIREINENPKKSFAFLLRRLLPGKMPEVFFERLSFDETKNLSDMTRVERSLLINTLKNFRITVNATGGFKEAIITQGGVSVKEVTPSTMESKKIRGLYICGELLDVDALTGGFNLQIAFSTGYLAGESIR
ncbi:MAG: NAD(P)/FAD-dependent oxidoreductase [Lachnospiraceae bacterium]|nr:NAD(P)/FAD-dependent oxidoreductase [Lachnospiraceae bacterium]